MNKNRTDVSVSSVQRSSEAEKRCGLVYSSGYMDVAFIPNVAPCCSRTVDHLLFMFASSFFQLVGCLVIYIYINIYILVI